MAGVTRVRLPCGTHSSLRFYSHGTCVTNVTNRLTPTTGRNRASRRSDHTARWHGLGSQQLAKGEDCPINFLVPSFRASTTSCL
jgi:hypothetical protein